MYKTGTTGKGLKILGTGSFVPSLTVGNVEFAKYVETSDQWITERTGIKERHFHKDKPNHQMAVQACKNALENAGVNADEIDMIIVSTCTPDFLYPCMSCIVQNEIGAENAACFDISAACTGFITALDTARSFLAAGNYKKILVAASEKLSSHVDFSDRKTCILFGDGAGAVVVEASDVEYESFLGAQGENINNSVLYNKIFYDSKIPFSENQDNEDKKNDKENENVFRKYMQMDGKAVYKFGSDAMQKSIKAVLSKADLQVEDIDLFVPHQANIRIIKTAAKTLEIPMEKIYVNIETQGNTSSACIPTCIDELNRAGKIKNGMRICLVGFGGGFTYGAVVLKL